MVAKESVNLFLFSYLLNFQESEACDPPCT